MREDLQKKFILLSHVAKEKKYAQEYMGLLARRGDIGSIRIGKRWYTTWEWFEEFLENSQKKSSFAKAMEDKKEIVSEAQAVQSVKAEPEAIALVEKEVQPIKISAPFVFPEKEKVYAVQFAVTDAQREEKIVEEPASSVDKPAKITVAVKEKRFEMPVRKNISAGLGDIRGIGKIGERKEIRKKVEISQVRNFHQERNSQSLPQAEARFKNISVEEKNRRAIPYMEIKFKNNTGVFSPDFSGEEKMSAPLFPRFVFATGFAIIFLLVAASGYFVFSDGMFKKGTVAGASSERNGGFSGISSGGEYFFARAGDKMKESLSVSRVVVEAAKEKGN